MKTVTITNLAKKQVTLTLRPTSGLGAEPNVFVSAEVFAQYEADAANYTRERAIAEYDELKDLAIANKDYNVARKIMADILRLKMIKPGSYCKEIFFAADADLAAIPTGSTFDEIVQSGHAYAVKDFSTNTQKDDLAQLNGDTALHDTLATEEAKQSKSVASIVGERMKLLQKKHDSKEFTRDVAYASLEELRHVSMRHGGLNTARLLIRDKCEICDIPSLHQRKFTKSPAQQKKEAEKAARLEEERIAEKQAEQERIEEERIEAEERLAAEQRRLAEEKEAAEIWRDIKYFVINYPRKESLEDSFREKLMKQVLNEVHTYAQQQKRLGSTKDFPVTVKSVWRIHNLLFDEMFRLNETGRQSMNDGSKTDIRKNFKPYMSVDAGPTPEVLTESALRHLRHRLDKLTKKYSTEKNHLPANELEALELSLIKLREKQIYLLYKDSRYLQKKVYVPHDIDWTLEKIIEEGEKLVEQIAKDGWGESFEERGEKKIKLLLLDRGRFRWMYEDKEMRADRERRRLMIFVGFARQPFPVIFHNDDNEMGLWECFSKYKSSYPIRSEGTPTLTNRSEGTPTLTNRSEGTPTPTNDPDPP